MKHNVEIIRISYLLGLIDFKEVLEWADNEIRFGGENEDLFELSTTNKRDSNKLIALLNSLSKNSNNEVSETKRYFYDLFLQKLVNKEIGIIKVEEYLVSFYSNVLDKLSFSEEEKLSFSIINNDLMLRNEQNIDQLNDNDILNFLKGVQIK